VDRLKNSFRQCARGNGGVAWLVDGSFSCQPLGSFFARRRLSSAPSCLCSSLYFASNLLHSCSASAPLKACL
jgi:hypothetical protein